VNPGTININALAARLSARDAEGHLLSALTGNESEAELRAVALLFVETCPANCAQARCPFRILGGLYHGSARALINSMTRSALVGLFDMEFEFRECVLNQANDSAANP
jgi:hypothetical protein